MTTTTPIIPLRASSLPPSSPPLLQAPPPPHASSSSPTTSPLRTTFVLPPTPTRPSLDLPSPNTGTGILERLGRKLSIGRSTLVRRVSSRKSSSPDGNTTRPASTTVVEDRTAKRKSTRRGLGRSKSEGTPSPRTTGRAMRRNDAAALEVIYGRNQEEKGKGELYWEESLGICWDGREAVSPEHEHVDEDVPLYTSNSDFLLPPALQHKIVYASTLSTFPLRAPLKTRASDREPPKAELSPASLVIQEYRRRDCAREEEDDESGESSEEERIFDKGEGRRRGHSSEESNTSLESIRDK